MFGRKSIAAKAHQTDYSPAISDARAAPGVEEVRANNRPRRGLFGGYPVMTHILGGSNAVAAQREAEQQAALVEKLRPIMSGENPEITPDIVLQAAMVNPQVASALTALRAQEQPEYAYERGFRYNKKAGDGPAFVPNIPEGAEPLLDTRGNVAGFRTADGYIQHIEQTEAAKERAKGPEIRSVPRGDGGYDLVPLPRGLHPGGQPPAAFGSTTPPQVAAPSSAAGNVRQFRDAIASIESRGSGDYKALGPVTRTGDRAYGRYQVMGANIAPWTRAALGREMTPQEFLANPQAQDAVFDHVFGGYVQEYGSPEEAASVWFTGRPLAQGANRRDVNGMTGSRYVEKFANAAGRLAGEGGQAALVGGDDLTPGPQPIYSTPGKPRDPAFKPNEALSAVQGLKKDFESLPQVRVFRETAATYNTLRALEQKGDKRTGADDIAGIFMFMKMLDPTSAVREGEYATAANSGGVPDWVVNTYNRVLKGGRLTKEQFGHFTSAAAQLVVSRRDQYDQAADGYRTMAQQNGFDPDIVAPKPGWRRPAQQPRGDGPVRVRTLQEAMALKPGTVFIDPNGVRRTR